MSESDFSRPIPDNEVLSATIEDLYVIHDPTGLLRDRVHKQHPGEATPKRFFDYLASKLYPEEVAALGPNGTGQEMIFMNAVHMGLITEGLHEMLGISEERATYLHAYVQKDTENAAEAVIRVSDFLDDGRNEPEFPDDDRLRQIVRVGRVAAAIAHDGQIRRNKQPYYYHLERSATRMRIAWSKAMRIWQPDDLYAKQLVTYVHDAPEDGFNAILSQLASPRPFISPLVVEKIALKQQFSERIAKSIGRAPFIMMREADVEDHKMHYVDPKGEHTDPSAEEQADHIPYVSRLLSYGIDGHPNPLEAWSRAYARELAAWSKPVDNLDNWKDSRVRAKDAKRYEKSIAQITESSPRESDLRLYIRFARSIHRRTVARRVNSQRFDPALAARLGRAEYDKLSQAA